LPKLPASSIRRVAARTNLTAFTEALGYTNVPFQTEWYDFLQYKFSPLKTEPDKIKRYLLLWPRGHAKTETTTINYTSWLVGNHPNIHIAIITKTATLAENILLALMTRFESDDRYIEIFGEIKPKITKKWTSSELIVERMEISKNPTIKAVGLMGAITGGRSDLIICDDLIDEENVRTQTQIQRASDWFHKVLFPTLYPWGGIIVIGNRWSYADLYSQFMPETDKNGNIIKPNWHPNIDIKRAIQPDGTPLWPEYWSIDKLEERRQEVGSIIFNCQYMNDPTGMEGNLLKSEWLHPYETEPPPNLPRYAAIDPALGESDFQALATLSYDKTNNQGYLEDVWAQGLSFPEFLRYVNRQHGIRQYSKIFIESNAFQKILMYVEEFKGLPIVASSTTKNKEQRFIPMSSHFESKRILINPRLNNMHTEFWNEWVQFPRGQHDDALDAVEIVTREIMGKHRDPIQATVGPSFWGD